MLSSAGFRRSSPRVNMDELPIRCLLEIWCCMEDNWLQTRVCTLFDTKCYIMCTYQYTHVLPLHFFSRAIRLRTDIADIDLYHLIIEIDDYFSLDLRNVNHTHLGWISSKGPAKHVLLFALSKPLFSDYVYIFYYFFADIFFPYFTFPVRIVIHLYPYLNHNLSYSNGFLDYIIIYQYGLYRSVRPCWTPRW